MLYPVTDNPSFDAQIIHGDVYNTITFSLFQDFVEMIIHHVVTIALLSFAWGGGMVRIAVLVIVVHDAVDYWMEVSTLELL